MNEDTLYMQRCLELAANGLGRVSPNPLVGAVIVHENRIIGEGYHRKYGEAHAEVNAIDQVLQKQGGAGGLLKKATLYVNLEPCAHQGKTPPCTDLIIKHGIPRVVIGVKDPSEKVAGKGIGQLREAGIEVVTGVLEEEASELNHRFITMNTRRRPYIILKWAETAQGYFAPQESKQHWITGPLAKKLVHRWRSEEDAVMVGYRTALTDNPRLTVREWSGRDPVRIVVDPDLGLPANLHLFDHTVKTVVFNKLKTDVVAPPAGGAKGDIWYVQLESMDYLPQMVLYQLFLMDIQSVIIEGGVKTLQAFIWHGLWDEARIFTGTNELSEGIPAPVINGRKVSEEAVGPDRLSIYKNT